MILKAYKYRIYPNNSQATLLAKTFGCVRVTWNHNVEVFNKYNKDSIEQVKPLTSTELRKKFEWMTEVSAAAIQQKEIDFKSSRIQLINATPSGSLISSEAISQNTSHGVL